MPQIETPAAFFLISHGSAAMYSRNSVALSKLQTSCRRNEWLSISVPIGPQIST